MSDSEIINFGELRELDVRDRRDQPLDLYDLVFDDGNFTVEDVVVDTGNLFSPFKRAVPTTHFSAVPDSDIDLRASMTGEELERAPHVDADPPLCREAEVVLFDAHGWTAPLAYGLSPYAEYGRRLKVECGQVPGRVPIEERDSFRRSMREIVGYRACCVDGAVGVIDDVLIDTRTWRVLYMVVRIGWLFSRRVMVLPTWVSSIDWAAETVEFVLTRKRMQECADVDTGSAVDADHVLRLQAIFQPLAEAKETQEHQQSATGPAGATENHRWRRGPADGRCPSRH